MKEELEKLTVYANSLIVSIQVQQDELEAEKLAVQRVAENNFNQSKALISRQKTLNLMAESIQIDKREADKKMAELVKLKAEADEQKRLNEIERLNLKAVR